MADPNLFLFGLDLGQTSDPSALTISQRTGEPPAEYQVRHIQRWELGTAYQAIAKDVARMMTMPQLGATERVLVVDQTGVGRPVVEMLRNEGLEPIGVTITAGFDVTRIRVRPTATATDREPLPIPSPDAVGGYEYRVPKRDLVGVGQMLLQSGRLRIAANLSEAAVLRDELLNFRLKVSKAGNDTYEAWRQNDHDDEVLALVTSLWFSENELPGGIPGSGHKKRPIVERPFGAWEE